MTAPELVIVGDEAWFREDWERLERRRARDRARYQNDPRRHEAVLNRARMWSKNNPDPRIVGSLHTLACQGPTRLTGCICYQRGTRKIRMYDKPVER